MRHMRFISFMAVLGLLVVPLAVLAQDGEEMEMQEYTSPDGFLTLSYPVDWVAQESDFLYGATIANSQDVFDTMEAAETSEEEVPIPSGAVIINVVLATVETFQSFGMTMEEGMTSEEMFGAFLEFISAPPEGGPEGAAEGDMAATEEAGEMAATEEAGGMEGAPEVGEVQTLEFADGRQVAWAPVEYPGSESDVYMLYEVGNGVFAVLNVYTAPGELTQESIDLAAQIAETVQFTGTVDDLAMEAPAVEESDVDPSTLDGNALVDERCTTCHTRERIDEQDKDEEGWIATVDRMISYGAELDSAERQAVIDYLVETH